MERERVKNTPKSLKLSQIEVVTNWRHTDEASPAFRRLIALLLEDKEGKRSDEQGDARKSTQ